MKKQILAVGVFCASLFAITAKTNDPVLMNVAGKDVRLSEFEYLYNKNNAQQVQPQTLDEYVDMFVNFKLKVAAAEAAGIDTTQSFLTEYTKFRNELSEPYLRDPQVADAQIAEAYDHMQYEVLVSHIMLPLGSEAVADSLRQAILDGSASYEDVARRYSKDGYSAPRGGLMGKVVPGRYPWPFEQAAYALKDKGEISPVVNSGIGLHLIRLEDRTPAKGQVHASHILLMTRNVSDSVAERQKVLIDSLYAVVSAPGADFADIARRFSQDPGSASKGGDLGWFGSGMMVEEFDSVAFALPDGAISKPFRTSFGWHIINRSESKGVGSLDDNRQAINAMIERDPYRSTEAQESYARQAVSRYKGKINEETIKRVADMARRTGGVMDSTLVAQFASSKLVAFTLNGQKTTLGELTAYIPSVTPTGADAIARVVRTAAVDLMTSKAVEMAREDLAASNPEYRNLINEYRDGILLFEISNRNVWDRASSDAAGLAKFFDEHRADYSWEAPKFKSYIFFASNDSILNAALAYATDSIAADAAPADLTAMMRTRFGRDIKVERVIAAKGENAITDYLGFGEPRPADGNSRWNSYAAFRGRVIAQPEDAADVRGAVVADYQAALEREWLDRLRAEYPVKIDRKVLKQVGSK